MDIDPEKKKAIVDLFENLEEDNEEHMNVDSTHKQADKALLELIGDEEITQAFNDLTKWYS